jgi:hypothetical protein
LYKAPAQSQQSNCFRGASFFLFSFPLCVARLLGPIISLPKSRAELKKQRREILTGEIEEIGKAKKKQKNTHEKKATPICLMDLIHRRRKRQRI